MPSSGLCKRAMLQILLLVVKGKIVKWKEWKLEYCCKKTFKGAKTKVLCWVLVASRSSFHRGWKRWWWGNNIRSPTRQPGDIMLERQRWKWNAYGKACWNWCEQLHLKLMVNWVDWERKHGARGVAAIGINITMDNSKAKSFKPS